MEMASIEEGVKGEIQVNTIQVMAVANSNGNKSISLNVPDYFLLPIYDSLTKKRYFIFEKLLGL